MKKLIFTTLVAFMAIASAWSQNWSTTIIDGLPGIKGYYMWDPYYSFTSELITPYEPTDRVRITVIHTITDQKPNGNNVTFALSELSVLDKTGREIPYSPSSNADHNTLSSTTDGGGLAALSDNNYSTYFHSMWLSPAVTDYHYIDLELSEEVDQFKLQWATRVGNENNAPMEVQVSIAPENGGSGEEDSSILGSQVSNVAELAAAGKLFILKGNAVKNFTTAGGQTYTGNGPVYMQYAEFGTKSVSSSNIMQLVPAGDDRYIVYWPVAGKFLANSAPLFNGLNGWQLSTTEFLDAALVKFTGTGDGDFEMQYDGVSDDTEYTLYVGAEMREGVNSKMKTFDLVHKQALENEDYTQGYSLPIAFNWSIYNATVDDDTFSELYVTLPQLAIDHMRPVISIVNEYLHEYGDHNGNCVNEDDDLRALVASAEAELQTISSVARVSEIEAQLMQSLSRYMSIGLIEYENQVKDLLANSTFSTFPYTVGTYPEASKALLESTLASIAAARAKAGTYTAEQYETLFSQIEADIEAFEETKIESNITPDPDEDEEELVDGEVVYVYLPDGGVDAFSLASIDGDYYTENGILYFPIKDGDVIYYEPQEYDSCSMVAPELPFMTSFKFNNKYNPNLNVDIEADTVTPDMYFRCNAIGKWLTASFNLSDERAVAYVDTVLQESKVTRQSFAGKVVYKVTYPGYNIVERVKIQDEIWSDPSTDGDTIEVALTADMLSTNKPSQMSNEGLGSLLDGNPSTIFHSTWGAANNETLNVDTYITIDLPEALERVQLYYQCRPATGYNPLVWEIYASNNGGEWELVRTLDYLEDNMPRGGAGQEYTSPTIELGGSYTKLKILQTDGEYSKNHFVLSELRLYKVLEGEEGEPEKIQDAVYENRMRPFGRKYNVFVEWLTDNPAFVPRIDIDIEDGRFVTSKEYYLEAEFRISGFGVYEDFVDSVQIKGRGNSSWGHTKKPYRLKFAEKVKPFGLTKGKSWVLLANAQAGSLMANAISMKMAQMAGAKYANHIIPVELYMNGKYMGNYMFTEKVGMANNSVDINEDDGYLLEFDTYTDEAIHRTGKYSLPVKIAEPDLADYASDVASARRTAMLEDVKEMSDKIFNKGDIESVLDVDAAARFFLVNDYSLNMEINHPKSTFLFKNEVDPEGKMTFGPVWDFDWGYGYESRSSYCYTGQTSSVINTGMSAYRFWQDLTSIDVFKKHYYKVWKEFLEKNSMDELMDYIDCYYAFAKNSFENNAAEWGYDDGFSESDRDRAKQWLEDRKNYIYNNLTEYNLDDLIYTLAGDVNKNNQLTVHDVALIVAYLNNFTHRDFDEQKADCNGDGIISMNDAYTVADYVIESEAPSPMYWYNTPLAAGALDASRFELEVGEEALVPVSILKGGESYNAIQFDVKVPEGVFVNGISLSDGITGVDFSYAELGLNTYRVVAFTEDNTDLTTEDRFADISVQTFSVIEEDARNIDICNVYVVDSDNDELRMGDLAVSFGESTGMDNTFAAFAVSGGECIKVTALEAMDVAVYSVDGRLVSKVRVKEGTTTINVSAGMYIVNGQKVLVK